MSTTSLPAYKKPPHQRDDSGELDVFEAARYFSDYNDNNALVGSEEIVIKDGRQQGYLRQGRASLDLPSLKQQQHQHYYKQYHQNYTISQQLQQQQQHREEKKKHKQPSSPGGKIAHFLNSIFNQTIMTSKKKKQTKSTQSMKDEDESPSGRRKRRSSMSYIRSTNNNVVVDAKSMDDSSNLGFRTPPSYTMSSSTKPYQNAKSFVDYKQVLATLSKYKIHENGNNVNLKDDKIKGNKNGIVEKAKNYGNSVNHGDYQEKKREIIKKFNEEVDDGAESDESSDLFELKIDYDFEFCSSGLPVYETTHLDNIKRPSTTITSTNGSLKH
ncbi:protein BIG GRAIN 1-like E [Silene latifolia]|uniref:protein BIG GRAIN 1-like E n=1 Tax=Silene latifolia TaxID=37657 RepID=UPI003D77E5F0